MFACMSTFDIIFKPNQNLCLWPCLWCASIKTRVFMYVDINAYICRCVHPCIHKMAVQGSSHFIGSVICRFCGCCAQPFIRQTSLRCKAFFQPVVQATWCHTAAFYFAEQFNFYFHFTNVNHTGGAHNFVPTWVALFWYPDLEPPPFPLGSQGWCQTCDHPESTQKFVPNLWGQNWSHIGSHPLSQ